MKYSLFIFFLFGGLIFSIFSGMSGVLYGQNNETYDVREVREPGKVTRGSRKITTIEQEVAQLSKNMIKDLSENSPLNIQKSVLLKIRGYGVTDDEIRFVEKNVINFFPNYVDDFGEKVLLPQQRVEQEDEDNLVGVQRVGNDFEVSKPAVKEALVRGLREGREILLKYSANHLVEVLFLRREKSYDLELYAYRKDGYLFWKGHWEISKKHAGELVHQVGLTTEFRNLHLDTKSPPMSHSLLIGVGQYFFAYGEVLMLLNPNFIYDYQEEYEDYEIRLGFDLGFQVNFNLFRLADYWSNYFSLFFVMKGLIGGNGVVKKTSELEQLGGFKFLLFSFNLGLQLEMRKSNIYFEVGMNPLDVTPYFVVGSKF